MPAQNVLYLRDARVAVDGRRNFRRGNGWGALLALPFVLPKVAAGARPVTA